MEQDTSSIKSSVQRPEGSSRTALDIERPSSPTYSTIRVDQTLVFPEQSYRRMDYRLLTVSKVLIPMRFFARSGTWSGAGVQGYPWVRASTNGQIMANARVHGRPYWDGDDRCYQIDLGRELRTGDELVLVTQAMYIDESGSFQPHLSYRTTYEIDSLTLRAAFKRPPGSVTYSYRAASDLRSSHTRQVSCFEEKLGTYATLSVFEILVSQCRPGTHTLSWVDANQRKERGRSNDWK